MARVRIPPAPPFCHQSVIEGGHAEKSSAAERPGTALVADATCPSSEGTGLQNRNHAGASPAVASRLWVVVLIAARRARNAEETERNRPAPPFVQVLDVQADGLVSKSDREGASPSGPANFFRRSGRSSDGAWLKPTRARRATAGLHHFLLRVERGFRRVS